jgi:hypothetical protein
MHKQYNLPMEQTYVRPSSQCLTMYMFRSLRRQVHVRQTRLQSTSPQNKRVWKSYREICMWPWTQVGNTKVRASIEGRKEGRKEGKKDNVNSSK